MDDDGLIKLKKNMSELVDAELLRIVEVGYADYRQDALDCAKQELSSRGVQFNQQPGGQQPAEPEEEENNFHHELVTVATFSAPYEAQLAKGLLETNGIQAFVADEYTIGINWFYSNALGGVRVQVAETDAGQSLKLLDSEVEPGGIDPQTEESWGDCPNCGSRNIAYFTAKQGAALLSLLLLGIPLLFPSKKLRCLNCNRVWNYQDGRGNMSVLKVAMFAWVLLIAAVVALAEMFPTLFGDDPTGFPPFRHLR